MQEKINLLVYGLNRPYFKQKQKNKYYNILVNLTDKSHMLDIFLISSMYYKFSYKLWFYSLKEFK